MKLYLAAALTLLGACAATTIDVTPLRPSPHPLAARQLESVTVYQSDPPAGAVGVFTIDARGGSADERQSMLRSKAAELGCDGLVIHAETATERRDVGESQTGALNDHREIAPAHMSATCIVLPSSGG